MVYCASALDTFLSPAVQLFGMGGLGKCPCCKMDKELTEHHVKAINKTIMICRDCHNVIEEYLKLLKKYGYGA
jgi:hypothetical protein